MPILHYSFFIIIIIKKKTLYRKLYGFFLCICTNVRINFHALSKHYMLTNKAVTSSLENNMTLFQNKNNKTYNYLIKITDLK